MRLFLYTLNSLANSLAMETTTHRNGVIVSSQVSAGVREQLERLAAEADRSLSAEIRRALARHVEQEEDSR